MTASVHHLDLPEVDVFNLDRSAAIAAFEAAREQHWLARVPLGYAVTRYEDVTAVLRDRRFHSALSLLPQMSGIEGPMRDRQERSILATEGAKHTRLRRLASPAFTPKATDRLRPFMRQVIGDLVDRVAATGTCELVGDICEPYPIPILCELLGAPKDDWKLFSDLGHRHLLSGSSTTTSPTISRPSKLPWRVSTTTSVRWSKSDAAAPPMTSSVT